MCNNTWLCIYCCDIPATYIYNLLHSFSCITITTVLEVIDKMCWCLPTLHCSISFSQSCTPVNDSPVNPNSTAQFMVHVRRKRVVALQNVKDSSAWLKIDNDTLLGDVSYVPPAIVLPSSNYSTVTNWVRKKLHLRVLATPFSILRLINIHCSSPHSGNWWWVLWVPTFRALWVQLVHVKHEVISDTVKLSARSVQRVTMCIEAT